MFLQSLYQDAADLRRHFFGAHDDGEDGLNIAAAAEKAINRLKKMRQKSIKDFFSANWAASSCAVEWSQWAAWRNNSLRFFFFSSRLFWFLRAAVSFGGEYILSCMQIVGRNGHWL